MTNKGNGRSNHWDSVRIALAVVLAVALVIAGVLMYCKEQLVSTKIALGHINGNTQSLLATNSEKCASTSTSTSPTCIEVLESGHFPDTFDTVDYKIVKIGENKYIVLFSSYGTVDIELLEQTTNPQ